MESQPSTQAPAGVLTRNGSLVPEGRGVMACAAGSALILALLSWLIFHGGAKLIFAAILAFFEGWRALAHAHPEASGWVLGLPALFSACRAYTTRKPRYLWVTASALSIGYFTLWVALSDKGCAGEGFLASIAVAFFVSAFGAFFHVITSA